jgi:exonuclease VII small subunit
LFAEPPGVPGIHDMVDIDTLLWRSGLLEDDEVDSDGKISSKYRPSAQALTRSSIAAANLETPSESLRSQDFEFLQLELKAVVEKSYALNLALNEAEATIELLSSNNGSLAKLRLGEESLSLKKALLEKENDLQAIIWKMNELNLVNKTYDKKLSNMVEHMDYLTEALDDVQDEYRNAIESNRKTIKKLQDDGQQLSSLVNSLTLRKEESGNQLDFTPLFSVQSEFNPQISIHRDIQDSLYHISHSKELPTDDSSTSEISENGKMNGVVINDEYTDELKQMIQKWSQYPDEMLYVGAKLNSYSPVRFTEKFGPQVRLATFQDFIRSVKC